MTTPDVAAFLARHADCLALAPRARSALLADAAHLRADVFVTLAVLLGLLLTRLGWRTGDAWTTLLVAVLILRTGVHILRETIPVLVDEAVYRLPGARAVLAVRPRHDRVRGRLGAAGRSRSAGVGVRPRGPAGDAVGRTAGQ